MNRLLHLTWKSILSFCKNNNIINYEIQFKTIKTYTNLSLTTKNELNVLYQNGFDYYYIPMNFRTLFMDKTKFYNINLKPNLIHNHKLKLKYKNLAMKEKSLEIKINEITIFQLFRENLYQEQCNFGNVIKKLKDENPKATIKYYIMILTAGDKLINSIFYEQIKSFMDTFTNVDDILVFSYLIDEFHEMTKYYPLLARNIYIFGLNNEPINFELIPDKAEKSKELLAYYVNKFLLKFYEKEITKNQYKSLKETWRDFLTVREHNNTKTLFEIELSKIKYFDNKKRYFFKCYNHEKKIYDENNGKNTNQNKELIDLKLKINKLLE